MIEEDLVCGSFLLVLKLTNNNKIPDLTLFVQILDFWGFQNVFVVSQRLGKNALELEPRKFHKFSSVCLVMLVAKRDRWESTSHGASNV